MTELVRVCSAIDEQNEGLMKAMDAADFDPAIALDCTLNSGQYKITDFFDVLKSIPYGQTPKEDADAMLESTDRLIAKIIARYGDLGNVNEKALAAAHAFRRSKRVWRISKPYASMTQKRYAQLLDEAREKILNALDDLNMELAMTVVHRPSPNSQRSCTHRRRTVSLVQAVKLLAAACEKAQLADQTVKLRTFQRWESGEAEPKANYTAKCRDSLAAFVAWTQCYIAEEKSRLRSKCAVAYADTWRKHSGGVSMGSDPMEGQAAKSSVVW